MGRGFFEISQNGQCVEMNGHKWFARKVANNDDGGDDCCNREKGKEKEDEHKNESLPCLQLQRIVEVSTYEQSKQEWYGNLMQSISQNQDVCREVQMHIQVLENEVSDHNKDHGAKKEKEESKTEAGDMPLPRSSENLDVLKLELEHNREHQRFLKRKAEDGHMINFEHREYCIRITLRPGVAYTFPNVNLLETGDRIDGLAKTTLIWCPSATHCKPGVPFFETSSRKLIRGYVPSKDASCSLFRNSININPADCEDPCNFGDRIIFHMKNGSILVFDKTKCTFTIASGVCAETLTVDSTDLGLDGKCTNDAIATWCPESRRILIAIKEGKCIVAGRLERQNRIHRIQKLPDGSLVRVPDETAPFRFVKLFEQDVAASYVKVYNMSFLPVRRPPLVSEPVSEPVADACDEHKDEAESRNKDSGKQKSGAHDFALALCVDRNDDGFADCLFRNMNSIEKRVPNCDFIPGLYSSIFSQDLKYGMYDNPGGRIFTIVATPKLLSDYRIASNSCDTMLLYKESLPIVHLYNVTNQDLEGAATRAWFFTRDMGRIKRIALHNSGVAFVQLFDGTARFDDPVEGTALESELYLFDIKQWEHADQSDYIAERRFYPLARLTLRVRVREVDADGLHWKQEARPQSFSFSPISAKG